MEWGAREHKGELASMIRIAFLSSEPQMLEMTLDQVHRRICWFMLQAWDTPRAFRLKSGQSCSLGLEHQ